MQYRMFTFRYSGGRGGYSSGDMSGEAGRVRHLDDYWYDSQHHRDVGDEETYTSDTTTPDHRYELLYDTKMVSLGSYRGFSECLTHFMKVFFLLALYAM